MSNTSSTYVPKLEVLHALMIGIVLALATVAFATILIGLLNGEILLAISKSFHTYGVIKTIQNTLLGLIAAVFTLGFWYAFLLLFAMPQFFFLVLPLLKIFSSGLQGDAHRNWVFYTVSGGVTGGTPWLVLAYVLFGNSIDFFDILKLFVLPAFLCGAYAGVALKYRLNKLAALSSIEISIK